MTEPHIAQLAVHAALQRKYEALLANLEMAKDALEPFSQYSLSKVSMDNDTVDVMICDLRRARTVIAELYEVMGRK